jgi:ubiquitin-protein ligase
MANNLKQRLLRDIAELQANPYPNISLHVEDDDLTQACLILTADSYGPMHLTIEFRADYPLSAPLIHMDSQVHHPNIFGTYICASILNTQEGYTPAYTLKGIAIQILSFFTSERIEQTGGTYSIDLDSFRQNQRHMIDIDYSCIKCRFGMGSSNHVGLPRGVTTSRPPPSTSDQDADVNWPSPQQAHTILGPNARRGKGTQNAMAQVESGQIECQASSVSEPATPRGIQHINLPDELLLSICEYLETEELMLFAEAWDRVGTAVTKYDVIRTRELQCFCLKKDYMTTRLGVGIHVVLRGKIGSFESEFDLLSKEGFQIHRIRRSVQGVEFQHWLPLPISNGHWRNVKLDVAKSLSILSDAAKLPKGAQHQVIFHFMNDVVVKLNAQTDQTTIQSSYYAYGPKSTLTHASEKAIESYFHLFHLLLCLATEDSLIVNSANRMIQVFLGGANSKTDCPNLGHLLVAALISNVPMDDSAIKAIIKETITRNVVWMLDAKGSNMPELSYLEPSAVSDYRLQKTFDASKTSYRLLMFLNLFRRTAVGNPRKPLHQLRDEAFERHGAPPRGSAKVLADSIKRIHQVKNFPEFLHCMGIGKPSAAWFTKFLRECVEASHRKGYSKMPLTQGQAMTLRRAKEPTVEVAEGVCFLDVNMSGRSFFPGNGGGRDGVGQRGYGRRR